MHTIELECILNDLPYQPPTINAVRTAHSSANPNTTANIPDPDYMM